MSTTTQESRLSVTGTSRSAMPGRAGSDTLGTPEIEVESGSGFAGLKEAQRHRRLAEEEAERLAAASDIDHDGMSRKERRRLEKAKRALEGTFADYPHLLAMKPKEGYAFYSDYFTIDSQYATILSFFHDEAAVDNYLPFWGIQRITEGLGDDVTTVILEQTRKMSEKWVSDHMRTADKIDKLDAKEQDSGGGAGSKASKRRQMKVSRDMDIITDEISNGAAYLSVHMRLLVKAPSLKVLDSTMEKIRQLYVEKLGALKVAAYPGEQRQELSKLFAKNERKRGKGLHFTSVELAGAHSLVTNGLNDPNGEFVGNMVGDVNTSAVLFDVDNYAEGSHVVVADSGVNSVLPGRVRVPSMWGSKISQAALLNNHRAVHIILDGTNMDVLGPRLDGLTARLDMNVGDINMFELFGDVKDEQSLYSAHLEKLVLMTDQAYDSSDDKKSKGIILGELRRILNQFYIDNNMWTRNAANNRDKLRLVGLPHTDIPRLQDIVTYFDTEYKKAKASSAKDPEQVSAFNTLALIFTNLLETSGDLFNTYTNDAVDNVSDARRVIYDFSELRRRGSGIAMAQLVNVIGFAVSSLDAGDTLIIHGAERIDAGVKKYMSEQLEHFTHDGGRVAYLYNNVEKMIDDKAFNRFDEATWTMLGSMSDAIVDKYEKSLHREIPGDLKQLITRVGDETSYSYLRRGHTNVVFFMEIGLGINPYRAKRREELAKAAHIIGDDAPTSARRSRSVESEAVASLSEVHQEDKRVEEAAQRPRMRRKLGRAAKREAKSPRMKRS